MIIVCFKCLLNKRHLEQIIIANLKNLIKMQQNANSVSAITTEKTIELSMDLIDSIKTVFTTTLVKEMTENFPKGLESEMNLFISELMNETVNHFSLALTNLAPRFHSEPTRFHWLFIQEILTATEKTKRKIAKKANFEYDVEKDIRDSRKGMEAYISQSYGMETKLWSLMDQKRWTDALSIVRAIEIQRENEDIGLKVEVQNWKMRICAEMDYVDLVLESINKILDLTPGDSLAYQPNDANYVFSLILRSLMVGFVVKFTSHGKSKALSELSPQKFFEEQGDKFTQYLIEKILDGIFKTRTIKAETDLKNFLRSERENLVSSFRLGNIYVEDVMYKI